VKEGFYFVSIFFSVTNSIRCLTNAFYLEQKSSRAVVFSKEKTKLISTSYFLPFAPHFRLFRAEVFNREKLFLNLAAALLICWLFKEEIPRLLRRLGMTLSFSVIPPLSCHPER
jgi:hypothetical protein